MSCAGTLGTCTHGTGIDYGLIANFVSLQQLPQKKKRKETHDRASGKVRLCNHALQPNIVLLCPLWFFPHFSTLFVFIC